MVGVNIACIVNAADVCTSLGGRTCSGAGTLQANTLKSKMMNAKIILGEFFMMKLIMQFLDESVH